MIKESQASEAWILNEWLQTNKPNLKIPYIDISMAFWELSESESAESAPLATKEVSVILDKSHSSKSLENIESNTCAIAHVDAIANPIELLCMLSYQLKNHPPAQLVVELATMQIEDNQTLQELKSIISKNENMS